MKEYQIEETIIAYMDGRLSDAEGAELLHRVSVSPEIRSLLEQHIGLRQLSNKAVRNVAIRPEVEESIFANIARLQESEKFVVAPLPTTAVISSAVPVASGSEFSDRRLVYSIAFLVLAFGIGLGFNKFSDDEVSNDHRISANKAVHSSIAGVPSTREAADVVNRQSNGAQSEVGASSRPIDQTSAVQSWTASDVDASQRSHISHRSNTPKQSYKARQSYTSHLSYTRNQSYATQRMAAAQSTRDLKTQRSAESASQATHESRLTPLTTQELANTTQPRILTPGLAQYSLRTIPTVEESNFEFGIETSSGFTVPAIGSSPAPLSELRLHGAYSLDTKNVIGARFISGKFQKLSSASYVTAFGTTTISRSEGLSGDQVEEVYYQHREPIIDGKLTLAMGLGLGLLNSGGNTISAEIGAMFPLSQRLSAMVGFSAMRIHSYDATAAELMNQEGLGTPVSYQGPDVHNTLNGRIEYGLSYRF